MTAEIVLTQSKVSLPTRVLRWMGKWKTFTIGIILVALFVTTTLLAPLIAPYQPDETNYSLRFASPSWQHLMGTDEHGRDLFSRVLYGGQISLYVGIVSVLAASIVGIPIGLTTGFFGGLYDNVISRINDAFFAIPGILWAIAIVAVLGPSANSALIALAISRLPVTIRMARAAIISAKENDYVEASRALGSSSRFIIFRSILPNTAGPLLVLISLGFAVMILSEAGLSYLGLSAQPPAPSWGNMLAESQRYLFDTAWFAFFPGLTLFMVVLGFNLVGDGVRDLLDPHRKRQD
jgi:peptide/nickel transport system permease protein